MFLNMKKIYFVVIITLLSSFSLKAQSTEGTDFWVTYGRCTNLSMTPSNVNTFIMQIRIVNGNYATSGTIFFTNLGTSRHFEIAPYEIYDYMLDNDEKFAVYNQVAGTTNYSIRITASNLVSSYSHIRRSYNSDVTNLLPVTALGTEYYHLSYKVNSSSYYDAYTVVATQDNTNLYHNDDFITTLSAGQVYYKTSSTTTDMTGAHITSNNPVAFFACHQNAQVPGGDNSCLYQQLAPENTFGKTFFVPFVVYEDERIRIVASKNGTIITQTGGVIKTEFGGQPTLSNLQAGQFVELEMQSGSNGCFIFANFPVGVCSYLRSGAVGYPLTSPAQTWISGVEQKKSKIMLAPFIQVGTNNNYALICTNANSKHNTKVAVGVAQPQNLSGGIWYDNAASGISFYKMPLTEDFTSYTFLNPDGMIIYGYGISQGGGSVASYYYLAGSAMRDLDAAFYANDIHFQDLKENPFCAGLVNFRAEINGLHPTAADKIRWFIDGAEQYAEQNKTLWNKTFSVGEYEIKMIVRYENEVIATKIGTLKIISCNQSAEFFANNIPSGDLSNHPICNKTGKVDFRAEIDGIHPDAGSLKWYVNDELQPTATNQLTWSKDFATGAYEIKMWVRYDNGTEETITATLKVEIFWIKMQNVRH